MRNAICLIIVALLTLQVSLAGMDTFEEINNDYEDNSEQNVKFSGRQGNASNGMNGNNSVDSDCSFTGGLDGIGGPLWDSSASYGEYDIVEWPANSGQFYQTQINSSGGSVEEGHWIGPCSCLEIAEASGESWDATVPYGAWRIVLHNGNAWIAQDAGTMAGDEPVVGNDLWVQCTHEDSTPCDELIGIGFAVWDNTTLVSAGDIYEFPADSSNFYMVAPSISNQTVGAPGVDLDAWDSEFCDCMDIWSDSGEPVWDSTASYPSNSVVEWPAGSGTLYIAWVAYPVDAPNQTDKWRLCPSEEPSGGPCEEFNGYGGMPWYNTTLVSAGEIYEFPTGSGHFYTISPGINNQIVGEPGIDLDAWSEKYCDCDDIWLTAGSPVWDSNTVYDVGMMVEYPIGTGDIWMAIVSQTTTGVTPDQPFADGNEWELCGGGEPAGGGPCGSSASVGVWDNLSRVSTGEVYEYPANSGNYYEVVIPGYVDQTVDSPTINLDIWAPVDCPCEEEWVAAGSPVWDASVTYSPNSVVEWPAGSSMLYITSPAPGPGDEPGTDPEWELCSSPEEPANGTECAGLTVVGVWDSSMNVTSGEIYEYPVNSGTYYQVNAGGPFWSVNAPDIDMDVWSPIDCPCKETWVANGQPVWVTGTAYPGNFVVEHPAGSGNLYMPLEPTGLSTGAGEPGVDTHWVLCDGEEPNQPSGNPCAGLNVSVWDNTTSGAVGDIYEYPANSGTYYQIIFTHEDANGGPDWVANPVEDGSADEFWVPYSCPCKETWVANGQPVWVAGTAYPGNYVVEHPAGSGNLYMPLESLGVATGAGEPGVDMHWVLCNGNGVNPGPCEGITTSGVWNSTTLVSVGDIFEYPVNSGIYYQATYVDSNGLVATAPGEDQDYEFWTPYACPCKETWNANGMPVWDATQMNYPGNYVVEWPAGSGTLYLSEGGGLTGSVEPGTDGHWILCEESLEAVSDPVPIEDSLLPSIGVALTLFGILSAATFVGRTRIE